MGDTPTHCVNSRWKCAGLIRIAAASSASDSGPFGRVDQLDRPAHDVVVIALLRLGVHRGLLPFAANLAAAAPPATRMLRIAGNAGMRAPWPSSSITTPSARSSPASGRPSPNPRGELAHVNAFTLLVAVALSAQATDAGVNRATRALFKIADTPEKMLALGEEGLIEHIRTIGLYRNKAKNVMKLSRILVEEYGGEVPNSRAALQSLPGVGRKTANVVLNMWWPPGAGGRHAYLPRRQPHRHLPGQGRGGVERAIEDNVPVDFQLHAHHWLILHGRYHLQGAQAEMRPPASSAISANSRTRPE